MTENEILNEVLRSFMEIVEHDKSKAMEKTLSFSEFYEFAENNEDFKQTMYGFFYKMLDEYITFRFYTEPIPALVDNKDYMEKYKKDVMETAKTFFNFGGIK